MTEFIDISTPLAEDMVVWPGSPGVQHARFLKLENGDPANASRLALDVHCGTHVDAPFHTLAHGSPMASVSLDAGLGEALVVEVADGRSVSIDMLQAVVPPGTKRVLLRTQNSRGGVADDRFDPEFSALSPGAATWLAEQGTRLVGVDYLSVQLFDDPDSTTHDVLLAAGVVILEGLRLEHVEPGRYELICLPIAVPELEAAPARAVLRPLEDS